MSIPSGSGSNGVLSITTSFLKQSRRQEVSSGREYITLCQPVVIYKQTTCTKSGHEPFKACIYSQIGCHKRLRGSCLPPTYTHRYPSLWSKCQQWLLLNWLRTCKLKGYMLCQCSQQQMTFEQCK